MAKKVFCLLLLLLLLLLFRCDNQDNTWLEEEAALQQQIDELYQNYDFLFKEFLANTVTEMGKEVLKYEEIHPDLLPKKLTFSGSYFELGQWVGLMARKHGISPVLRTPESREINRQIERMYRKIFPPFLDRARGIAWAYSQNLENLDLRHLENNFSGRLWWELFQYDEFLRLTRFHSQASDMCSVVSLYLEDEKRQLTGRNFDIYDNRPHFLVVSNLEGVYRTAGMTCYQLQHKMMDGINEKGLFMGIASNILPSQYGTYANEEYPGVPAICSPRLIRVVLDSCATVNQALDLIGKVRIWLPDELQHFLIADALGNSVVIEFDQAKNLHVFPRIENYLVMTNTAYLEGLDYLYDHCNRFRRATNMFREGVSDLDGFWEVVIAIRRKAGGTLSIWSSVADLKALEYDARFHSENWEIPHVLSLK